MTWPTRPKNGSFATSMRKRQGKLAGERRGLGHPALAKRDDLMRRADPYKLAHAKRLQPVEAARGLMPEHIRFDVELQAALRQAVRGLATIGYTG
jgi:hypothetical protein